MGWLQRNSTDVESRIALEIKCAALEAENRRIDTLVQEQTHRLLGQEGAFSQGATWWENNLRLLFPPEASPPPVVAPDSKTGTWLSGIIWDKRFSQFPDSRPVFIMGAPRSGTTAMCNSLRFGAKFFGWYEGHLFSKVVPLLTMLQRHWENSLAPIASHLPYFAAGHFDLFQLLDGIVRDANAAYTAWTAEAGVDRWVDKTPDVASVLIAPLLQHLYPQGRFIFLHRHPLLNIQSQLRKFASMPITSAVSNWTVVMRAWLDVRKTLDPSRVVELRQENLSRPQDDLVGKLTEFLGLTPKEAEGMAIYLQTQRPEKTNDSEELRELFLEDLDWPEDTKRICREACEGISAEWEYRITSFQ